jgi:hypothetical protein
MTWEAHAQNAGQLCTEFQFRLLASRTPGMTRELSREHLTRAFQVWPLLCRRVAELEAAAPNCAREGAEAAARARDFAEAREVAQ